MKKLLILFILLAILSGSSSISVFAKIPYSVEFIIKDESYHMEIYADDLKKIYSLRPSSRMDYFDGWYYDAHYKKPFSYLNVHTDHFTLYAKFNQEIPYSIVNTAT